MKASNGVDRSGCSHGSKVVGAAGIGKAGSPSNRRYHDSVSEILSKDDVAKVAKLAMLELSEEELASFTPQLAAILDHAKDMEALDVAEVAPTAHPYPLVNVFRPDLVEQNVDVRDEALGAGPDVEDHRFKVPPALGEEP